MQSKPNHYMKTKRPKFQMIMFKFLSKVKQENTSGSNLFDHRVTRVKTIIFHFSDNRISHGSGCYSTYKLEGNQQP